MNLPHSSLFAALLPALLMSTLAASAMGNTDREVQARLGTHDYLVIDLSGGPEAASYPVSFLSDVPPGGWTDEHKTAKLVMRRIPAGTFIMGASPEDYGRTGREIQRQVTLTTDFYIGVFQVTQRQWERVMGHWPPSRFDDPAYRDARPAEPVTYYRIRENPGNSAISPNWPQSSEVHPESFMGKLRAKTGLSTLDLPTEAQWEYACRAGTTTELYSGKNLTTNDLCPNLSELGRFRFNHPVSVGSSVYNLLSKCTSTDVGTAKVGSYLPNAWGLYDMYGNVWEWCLDWFEGHHGVNHDPAGPPSGIVRVIRGGSMNNRARMCRSAYRTNKRPNVGEGFRLCMTLP